MGSPTIFNGRRTKILTADGLLTSGNRKIDFDGPKNYVANGDFAAGSATTGFSLFNTTLTSGIPTGSISAGASSITTFQTTTSSPLAGVRSLETSIASGTITAGHGFISDNMTLDSEDKAKVLQIRFSYQATTGASLMNFSGTSSNTWAVYIYDNANSAWIQPAGVYNLVQSSGVGTCTATFQTPSNATTIRLAVICINANSSGAVAMLWDSFFVGPQMTAIGPAVSDWVSFTPTGSWTANTTYAGKWSRVGDLIRTKIRLSVSGAPTATSLTVNWLPSGLSVDTSKLNSTATDGTQPMGTAVIKSGGTLYDGSVYYNGTTSVALVTKSSSTSYTGISTNVNATTPATFASGDSVEFYVEAPISGWSSNSVVSADTDTRVVAAVYSTPATTSMNSGTTYYLDYGTAIFDTHSAVLGAGSGHVTTSGTGWRFVAPVSGTYAVNAQFSYSSATGFNGTSERILLSAAVDGSTVLTLGRVVPASADGSPLVSGYGLINLNAGQRLEIAINQDSGGALAISAGAGTTRVSINRLSGPAVITGTDTVAGRYSSNSGQTIEAAGSGEVVIYEDVGRETHSSMYNTTTGVFTAPVSGFYQINYGVSLADAAWTVGDVMLVDIRKNGSSVQRSKRELEATVTTELYLNGSHCVELNAGDTIDILVDHNRTGGNCTLRASAAENYFSIYRIGN